MQEHSRTGIGRFLVLDQKRNVKELTRTNRVETGSVKVDIPYSVDPVLWNEELCEAKGKGNCLFISVVTTTQPNQTRFGNSTDRHQNA